MIHETAIVDSKAEIGPNSKIGPYCIVGPNVTLGNNTILHSHVVLNGHLTIEDNAEIFPFACLGHNTPDLKYKGEESSITIGENAKIREYVTIHPGTAEDRMVTTIGNNCLLMVGVHIAHDCIIGNNVIMANQATLGGHVRVGDFVNIGGLAAVHQFVRIGSFAMIGGMSGVDSDVIPYGLVKGDRASLQGLNLIGLKRRNFPTIVIQKLREIYQEIFVVPGILQEKIQALSDSDLPEAQLLLDFLRNEGEKKLCLPKK